MTALVTLLVLEAKLLRVLETGRKHFWVDDLSQAQGLMFLCPFCLAGAHGCHYIKVWFRDRGVSDEELPMGGRWAVAGGHGLSDLTLDPSIHVQGGCGWHGWVRDGSVLTV